MSESIHIMFSSFLTFNLEDHTYGIRYELACEKRIEIYSDEFIEPLMRYWEKLCMASIMLDTENEEAGANAA